MKPVIKYINKDQAKFFSTLRKRVDGYFKENQLSKFGSSRLIWKSMGVFALYFVPYALLLMDFLPLWAMIALSAFMGIGMAGIGMAIMHDGNHGTFSSKGWLNRLMGSSIILVGGHKSNWKIQHNVLHHTYTNVFEVDEDIDANGLIRMSPHAEYKKMHRFQHIYAFLLYGLMTMFWYTFKDIKQLSDFHKRGLHHGKQMDIKSEIFKLTLGKVIYTAYMLVIPMLVIDSVPWWGVLVGFAIMHFVCGLTLAIIFQLAHLVEHTEQPLPDDSGTIENTWAVHQLMTTANFARKNKILSWYIGGLNYQVEHHIFPNISHIHYPEISKIVQETAKEFGVPYHEYDSFWDAFKSHMRLLKELGSPQPKMA
ncbi:fatty acid desaturase family protein [Acidiluteibacter ferrifornacis]|uniref:Acyl-CoA desaturase n=1 Tax=Acidiluteibacter ferrifornacis TaxID=2692424 RepID=A0A6N9NNL4_9FLAO|nr:acyl-CoA desaturase [Acidiluteibacter ferrifornacis]NBG66850.1 acyl-CoA desaturase [Acidiluteibacter ferrifornacis]